MTDDNDEVGGRRENCAQITNSHHRKRLPWFCPSPFKVLHHLVRDGWKGEGVLKGPKKNDLIYEQTLTGISA